MTIFQRYVSSVASGNNTVHPSAKSTYTLVNHIKEACYLFFPTDFELPKRRKHKRKMTIGHDKKKWIFRVFSLFFLRNLPKYSFAVHRFLWLTNYIKGSVQFKFRQNPMKNMVETEFWIFLSVAILTAGKKIFSIENLINATGGKNLHFQTHHGLSNWIFHPVIFFDFWFSHFPCKTKILNGYIPGLFFLQIPHCDHPYKMTGIDRNSWKINNLTMLELLEHTAELALERTLERTNTVNATFNERCFNNFLHFLNVHSCF